MTRRGTILLFFLAALIITWVGFVELHQQRPSDGPLFHFNSEKISRITIADGNDSHVLQRHDTFWEISTTPPDRASSEEVNRLLTVASHLRPLNILSGQELKNKLSLSSLGLQNPKRFLTLHQDGKEDQTLFIGNEAVGEKSLFARVDGQKAVVIIPSALADVAFRPSDDFRDPHLTTLELENLQEIVVTRGVSRLFLKKENQQWHLTEPIKALTSTESLQISIEPLLKGEALTRVAKDDGDLSPYGLDQPRATISLLPENATEPLLFSLGNAAEKTSSEGPSPLYLRSYTRHAIFKVPGSLIQLFMLSPESLRDHQLFKLNLDTVDRIHITIEGKAVHLQRQQGGSEDWILDDASHTVIPGRDIQKTVEALEKTEVTSFQLATPSNLAAVGLDNNSAPKATISFIAHLSENTPDEEAGDHTVLEISFGKPIGDILFARIGKGPELFGISVEALNLLKID